MIPMLRRRFLVGAGALAAAPLARPQVRERRAVLGILSPGTELAGSVNRARLLGRLSELGWTEGKTLAVERAYADDQMGRVAELAAALVAKKVDVIWTSSPIGAVAAARATTTIPIVFWRVEPSVEFGLVDSLARPGRNVTGIEWADAATTGKRIELLRETAPSARRLAVVTSPATDSRTVSGKEMNWAPRIARFLDAVRRYKFDHLVAIVGKPSDVDTVAAQFRDWGADCLYVADVPQTVGSRKEIIEMARSLRLPAMYQAQEWTQAGGLMSYGIVFLPALLRSAEMLDRILRGAKPSEIPVELPRDYELTVNLETARSLGLTIPQSILMRADRVIE